jgi:hypothetical protein
MGRRFIDRSGRIGCGTREAGRCSPELRSAPDSVGIPFPRIVEAIVAGRQPPELTAKVLTERIELPLLWSQQEDPVCCELLSM